MGLEMCLARVTLPHYERLVCGDVLWEPPEDCVSLDKVWAVLYRYLNFQQDMAFPRRMALAVAGGEPFADDVHGGPRALSPRLVAGIAQDLTGADQVCIVLGDAERHAQDLQTLSEHVELKGAYGIGTQPQAVARAFTTLRNFYRDAAFAGDGVIIWLT
jgi:hypothetical protein